MTDSAPKASKVDPDPVEQQVKKFKKELSSGTVALVLLSTLAKAEEPLYGYQIAKLLEHAGTDKQGSLYPVLRNMSANGLLDTRVVPSESGPPRKYFNISELGRVVLNEWLGIWRQTRDFVGQAIGEDSDIAIADSKDVSGDSDE